MHRKFLILLFIVLLLSAFVWAQFRLPTGPVPTREALPAERAALDKQIAAQFAPVIYQGLGDQPRFDYITNFDFDGDWKGDNNWANAGQKRYALSAYVYYSVIETATHYFVHYAMFHPRDYKGGLNTSALLDVLIKEGVRRAGKDPTGRAEDVALSHENDLEGALVVAEKRGTALAQAVVQYVETMAHNRYLKYRSGEVRSRIGMLVRMEEQHPLLFIEPKGHGVERYIGTREQLKRSVKGVLTYSYTGSADDPEKVRSGMVGYDLLPIYDTLWLHAQAGENDTYGEVQEYQPLIITSPRLDGTEVQREQTLGRLGVAFRGTVGFKNKARPPWGWFDDTERDRPRGEWFFDPASVVARHFYLDQTFPRAYIYHPFFNLGGNEGER